MNEYEIVIPAAPKDYNKVKFAILSACTFLNPLPRAIHVITPEKLDIADVEGSYSIPVYCHADREILGLNPNQSKFRRAPWIFQQFIKLFQNVTATDLYLVVDSDLIFNRPFDIFTKEGKKQFFLGRDQHHKPYFNLQQKLFGFRRAYNYSFISEVMLFSKTLSRHILDGFDNSVEKFYDTVCNLIDPMGEQYLIADYELYGNFCHVNFPTEYAFKKIKSELYGRSEREFTDDEIRNLIKFVTDKDFDVFTLHTWL